MWAAHAIFKRLFIRCDQARAGAAFDRHVADRHAAFHAEIADRFAAILDDIAGTASGAGFADHAEGDVFCCHAGAQLSGNFDLHVLAFALDQRLGGENMFNF